MGTLGMKLGPRRIDLSGKTFHRLRVIAFDGVAPGSGDARWKVRCECGAFKVVRGADLRRGIVKSCGCYRADSHTKHGKEGTRVYDVWAGMLQRCRNPKHRAWKNYGGRGIKVCKRWLKFEHFYADMGDPKGILDRIDNDGDYTPANCRWATWTVSNKNQRRHLKRE